MTTAREAGIGVEAAVVTDTKAREVGIGVEAAVAPVTKAREAGIGVEAVVNNAIKMRAAGFGIEIVVSGNLRGTVDTSQEFARLRRIAGTIQMPAGGGSGGSYASSAGREMLRSGGVEESLG